MGDGIFQPILEVVGEVLLAGILLLVFCVGACLLATPFVFIAAACDHGRFWPSVRRRYESVACGALALFELLPF